MSVTEIPVYALADLSDVDGPVRKIVEQEGRLQVGLCEQCFAMVPVTRMAQHKEAAHAG